jgi:hypothetical protein
MTAKQRIYLYDTTLRRPSACSREACEDGQKQKSVTPRKGRP